MRKGFIMEIGIDSFAAILPDPATGKPPSATDRMADLLEEIEVADRVGLDVFGMGEHHRAEFLDSAPAIILAAAAARTSTIRLTSAVTVLSAADPVRVFQEFATLDLISQGRAEIVVGRGSFGEAFPLFGFSRATMTSSSPRSSTCSSSCARRPIRHGRGASARRSPVRALSAPPSAAAADLAWRRRHAAVVVRAGVLGLPLMVAIIGGSFRRFRPLVDLYRESGQRAGHAPEQLKVGVHAMGFVGETTAQAKDIFFPGWAQMTTKVGRERGGRRHAPAVRGHGRPGRRFPDR